MTDNKKASKKYYEKMKENGFIRYNLWVTPTEKENLNEFLSNLRK